MIFTDDANPKDPREKPVPPRPKGQRPEPESTGGSTFGGFGGFGGKSNCFMQELLPIGSYYKISMKLDIY